MMKISEYNTVFTVKNDVNTQDNIKPDIKRTSIQEYSKSLEQKYGYFNSKSLVNGVPVSVNASEDHMKKCVDDPDAAALLEKKLDEFPDYVKSVSEKYSNNIKSINYKIDENGKPSVSVLLSDEQDKAKSDKAENETDETAEEQSGKTTVTVNAEKRSRQIAAAKNQKQIQAVIELLRKDISECKEGLSNGWCDENEVAKAEALLKRAQEKQAQLPADSAENDDPNADMEFLISSLM